MGGGNNEVEGSTFNPDYYLENNFTIIYPNGGSKESPATITSDSRYVEANPFPGYYVNCEAEIYLKSNTGVYEWGRSGWWTNYSSGKGSGTVAHQHNDDNIVVVTGSDNISQGTGTGGCSFAENPVYNVSSCPCRVKVWKVGKIES